MIDHINLFFEDGHWVVTDVATGEKLYSSSDKEAASMWAQRYVRINGCVLHIHQNQIDSII